MTKINKPLFYAILLLVSLSACSTYKSPKRWTLVFEDDFSSLSDSIWLISDRYFSNEVVRFQPEHVIRHDSTLFLIVNKSENEEERYYGSEICTRKYFGYGLYEVVMRAAPGNGIVSSFFTLKKTSEAGNEIDIEFAGKNPKAIIFNVWDKHGHENPETFNLNFKASEEYHSYAIEWTPRKIRWYVDGKRKRTIWGHIPEAPHRIFMNIWVTGNNGWAGKTNSTFFPSAAAYKTVRFYSRKSKTQ